MKKTDKGDGGKKPFDLEERTLLFTKSVVDLCKGLTNNTINQRYIKQLLDAAGSVGANYREANEKLSKKDFIFRMRIARKECKESSYWLEVLEHANNNHKNKINALIVEAQELRNIFTSIIEKTL